MKPLERRLTLLEEQGGTGLDHLSEDELRARIVVALEALAVEGVELPDGWRETGDLSAIVASAREQVEAIAV